MKLLLIKMDERKDSDEKSVKKFEEECNQEMDATEKLIAEGNSRLALSLSKKDFDDATIASALIDSANKKMSSSVKRKREELSLKRTNLKKLEKNL